MTKKEKKDYKKFKNLLKRSVYHLKQHKKLDAKLDKMLAKRHGMSVEELKRRRAILNRPTPPNLDRLNFLVDEAMRNMPMIPFLGGAIRKPDPLEDSEITTGDEG